VALGEFGPLDGAVPGLLELPGPPWALLDVPLALGPEDGGLCGVLGVEDGGLLGVEDGDVLGGLEGGVLGVLEGVPDGVPLGAPAPVSLIIWPLGSKRTCAVQCPLGSAVWSTTIRIEVWAPGARMPEVAVGVSQGASGVAVQLTGPVPAFQRVTSTSPETFERCVTLMWSSPRPLGLCDGTGSSGM
jgi:hypothetical protein